MTLYRSMRTLLIAVIVLLAANLIATIASKPATMQAQVLNHPRIMYKVTHVRCEEQEIQTVLDIFSRDGWELVSHYNDILILKKE